MCEVQTSVCGINLCHISLPSSYCANLFRSSLLLSLPSLCIQMCVCVCVCRWLLLQKVIGDVTVDCNAGSHARHWTQLPLLISVSASSLLRSPPQLCSCCRWHQIAVCVCVCVCVCKYEIGHQKNHLLKTMFLFISERHSNPCGKLLIHVAALLPKSCVCVCVTSSATRRL